MRFAYDESKAVLQPNGGWLAPRTDVRDEERCYVALNSAKNLVGSIQVFKDGSACYWREPGEQATRARSLEDAFANVFIVSQTSAVETPRG